jgi:predicted GIY-YIG superfamily endonuclease
MVIFFLDGTPSGVRTAQMQMSTVMAVAFRREHISQVRDLSDGMFARLTGPGVYILTGIDRDDGHVAYVGESQDALSRIDQHLKDPKKEFWSEAIVLVNKDDLLTKAHVMQIERQLIESARKNTDWIIRNSKNAKEASGGLPPHDIAACDEFAKQVKILVAGLGLDLFRAPVRSDFERQSDVVPSEEAKKEINETFFGSSDRQRIARMKIDESGQFVILKGSQAKVSTSKKVPNSTARMRRTLIGNGVLTEGAKFLTFEEDVPFKTSSAAAQMIAGCSYSGPKFWKTADNQTLEKVLGS